MLSSMQFNSSSESIDSVALTRASLYADLACSSFFLASISFVIILGSEIGVDGIGCRGADVNGGGRFCKDGFLGIGAGTAGSRTIVRQVSACLLSGQSILGLLLLLQCLSFTPACYQSILPQFLQIIPPMVFSAHNSHQFISAYLSVF